MFDSELILVRKLKKLLKIYSSELLDSTSKSIDIMDEVNLGYGIADLVAGIRINKNQLKLRHSHLETFDVALLNLIRQHKGIGHSEVLSLIRSSQQRLKIGVKKLIQEDLIEMSSDDYYVFRNYTEYFKDTIAVEAKLKDWKRALNQAYKYKWFADRSFVCMPTKNIKSAYKNIEMFKNMNVGLISVDENKDSMDIIHLPSKETPYSENMRLLLNERFVFRLNK